MIFMKTQGLILERGMRPRNRGLKTKELSFCLGKGRTRKKSSVYPTMSLKIGDLKNIDGESPTMYMITQALRSSYTMCMKRKLLTAVTFDVYENAAG